MGFKETQPTKCVLLLSFHLKQLVGTAKRTFYIGGSLLDFSFINKLGKTKISIAYFFSTLYSLESSKFRMFQVNANQLILFSLLP